VGTQGLEPADDAAFTDDPPGMLRLDEASELLLPEILELEQASDLPPSRVGDHKTARRGESLQTGR